jgi:hypothetical protein
MKRVEQPTSPSIFPSWDAAIAEAEQRIEYHKKRIKDFRYSVRVFHDAKERGDIWPGFIGKK